MRLHSVSQLIEILPLWGVLIGLLPLPQPVALARTIEIVIIVLIVIFRLGEASTLGLMNIISVIRLLMTRGAMNLPLLGSLLIMIVLISFTILIVSLSEELAALSLESIDLRRAGGPR